MGCKQLTWIAEEEVVAIGGSLRESKAGPKSQSLAFMPLSATSHISVSIAIR